MRGSARFNRAAHRIVIHRLGGLFDCGAEVFFFGPGVFSVDTFFNFTEQGQHLAALLFLRLLRLVRRIAERMMLQGGQLGFDLGQQNILLGLKARRSATCQLGSHIAVLASGRCWEKAAGPALQRIPPSF